MSSSSGFLKEGRTLVLCFDGTSNEYSDKNTNVVKFFSLLKKDDFEEQLCYYQAGIGTFFAPGVVSPLFEWVGRVADYAVAWYLDAHVMDGYRFLMQNYRVGDKICLFGFSRGAYTARALAGMLYKVGLLPRDNQEQIFFAYQLYKKDTEEGAALAAGFKQTFCQKVTIEFLGVFDTVASVGVVMGKSLPFTNSNYAIKTFRHALALDERRVRFSPNLYHWTPSKSDGKPAPNKANVPVESAGSDENAFPDDVLEVWFSGCHGDIGGGEDLNANAHSLADIPLRWMVQEVIKSQCGIQFDAAQLRGLLKVPPPDSIDAVQPIHDSLKTKPIWWILEILPHKYTWQDLKNEKIWHSSIIFNFGRGRVIRDPKPHFHPSVKYRMDELGYKPKAKWDAKTEIYIPSADGFLDVSRKTK